MPSSSSLRRALARRALIADITTDRKGWLQHGILALAISALGLGVAASVTLTGSAQNAAPVGRSAAVKAVAQPAPQVATRSGGSGTSVSAKLRSLADQRAEELAEASEDYETAPAELGQSAGTGSEVRAAGTREQARRWPRIGPDRATQRTVPIWTSAPSSNGKSCRRSQWHSIAAR